MVHGITKRPRCWRFPAGLPPARPALPSPYRALAVSQHRAVSSAPPELLSPNPGWAQQALDFIPYPLDAAFS